LAAAFTRHFKTSAWWLGWSLGIAKENVEEQPDCAHCREDETEYGEARITEELKPRPYLHEQRGAYDQGCQQKTSGDAVGNFLKTIQQEQRIVSAQSQFQLAFARYVENFIYALGQLSHKIFYFEERPEKISEGQIFSQSLVEDGADVMANGSVGIE
jgi:hypothetical protein